MPVFLLHSMKLLFTKPIPPNPAPSKIIPIISETLYIYLIGFQFSDGLLSLLSNSKTANIKKADTPFRCIGFRYLLNA